MLSVIIPIRGRAGLLGELLAALSQQGATVRFEVVVADNSDPADTEVKDVVSRFAAERPWLRRVDAASKAGAAYARNVGAGAARGRRLAFVDADDVVGDGWLEAIAAALKDKPVVVSRLEYERLNPPHVSGDRQPVQSRGLIPYRRPPFLAHASASGLGVQREVFDSVSGFDETYLVLEDTDLCWRLQLAGHPLHFEEDAVVHMRLRDDLRASFLQAFGYGVGHARLQRDYRTRGLPQLGPRSALRSLRSLVLNFPALFDSGRRRRYVRSLGHKLGRFTGSVRYGVWAA